MTIKERVESVRERIAAAALRVGRDPGDILVVAVAKSFPAGAIQEAIAAGVSDIGENRVQEARAKIPEIGVPCRWHMVGHLQTNKARLAVRLFDWIQSLDSAKLAQELEGAAVALGKRVRTMVEVNLAREPTKAGVGEGDLSVLLEQAASLPHLSIEGLMGMPPFDPNPEGVRPYFRRLFRLREEAAARFPELRLAHLSMGMSHDFEVAVEEGATMVRIGTAIFGPRPTG
ncbi:MAG: YggS family pyridoxal phosphate-dependent enzyme [candidate division NC10 bacterium]|nr:YggS family pyridoxal phosphate-dependent enzyme [candidate division NC10 bacterium]